MQDLNIHSYARLSNQVKMPRLGFGTGIFVPWTDNQAKVARTAIDAGYRLFDVASIYYTEGGIGKAIRESGIPREEFFISSKMWNLSIRRGRKYMITEFEETLRRLQTDYLDLYLIHWPVQGTYMEAWEFMEDLYYAGKVRAIGICNISRHNLMELYFRGDIMPHVLQAEMHPYCQNLYTRQCAKEFNIHYEAVFPFARGQTYIGNPVLTQIGAKYGKNIFQVILRWELQNGVSVLPGSTNPAHITSNADIYDFTLTEEDMRLIRDMNIGKSWMMKADLISDTAL